MSNTPRILIVDDDSDALETLIRVLKMVNPDYSFDGAGTKEVAIRLQEKTSYSAAVVDLCLSEQEGIEAGFSLIRALKTKDPSSGVIVLTGHGSQENGVRAIKEGASSFLEKPADIQHLSVLIKDAVKRNSLETAYKKAIQKERTGGIEHLIIGVSDETKRLREKILFLSQSPQPVLITGETGVGKGVAARALHQFSHLEKKKFIRYQPDFQSFDLINSTLFGHVKGSFTGATESRHSLLEEASGGTFFLDEVAELPKETQISLLGALQERMIRPIGSNKEKPVNFRLITATNAKEEKLISEGRLRADFYHRIASAKLFIPPLRERRADIEPLSEHFLQKASEESGQNVSGISKKALTLLTQYDYPGNIRELQWKIVGALSSASLKGRTCIEAEDIELESLRDSTPLTLHEKVEKFKVKLVTDALTQSGGNQSEAARMLKVSRKTLWRILEGVTN